MSSSKDSLPKKIMYSIKLRQIEGVYKIKEGVYALPDCDRNGRIPTNPKYVIVKHIHFQDDELRICSCNSKNYSIVDTIRQDSNDIDLDNLDIMQKLEDFWKNTCTPGPSTGYGPTPDMCIHAAESDVLWPVTKTDGYEDCFNKKDKQEKLWHLNSTMFGVFCEDRHTYGILNTNNPNKVIKCLTCRKSVTKCGHVTAYNKLKDSLDYGVKDVEVLEFISISSERIPYPLGEPFKWEKPKHLVPKFNPSKKCSHGHLFREDDPIASGWIQNNKATIYLSEFNLKCITYYRPTTSSKCECRQFADGHSEHLLNLDNKHLFPYEWLFGNLHKYQEGISFKASFRTTNMTRIAFRQSVLCDQMYEHLRVAYNCFLKLILIN